VLETINPSLRVVAGDLPDQLFTSFAVQPQVACDLETSGLDWRTDSIGTVQLYTPQLGAVVIHSLQTQPLRLAALFESPSVQKVFHHAPFDLTFIRAAWSMDTNSVRCTKIASKLLSPSADHRQHSLGPLLQTRLGVTLTKGAVRTSDWKTDQLSEEQLSYAANDVRYLLALLEDLRAALAQVGRLELYEDCCRFLPTYTTLETGNFPDVFSY
jgi:ribonuclease D